MLIWIVILPLVASITAGPRSGITWGALAIFTLIAFFILDEFGFQFKDDLSYINLGKVWLTEMVGLTIAILVFAIVSETTGKISSDIIRKHHQSLQLLNKAIDVASDAIHVISSNSEQLYQNKRFLEVFGFKASDLIDRQALASLYPDKETIREMFLTVYHGKSWNGELEMRRKDGSRFTAFIRTDALFDDSGLAYALIGIYTDITEQKKVQQALQESEEKYRMIAENASDVIWIRDLDLNLTYISPGVEHLRGYSAEELMGVPINQMMTPDSLNKVKKVLSKALEDYDQNPEASAKMELEMYKKGGGTTWEEHHRGDRISKAICRIQRSGGGHRLAEPDQRCP